METKIRTFSTLISSAEEDQEGLDKALREDLDDGWVISHITSAADKGHLATTVVLTRTP